MKKVLSTLVAALVALSFAAVVSAQQTPATDQGTTAPMTNGEQTGATETKTPTKKHKKHKKHKKAKKSKKTDMQPHNIPSEQQSTQPGMTAPSTPATPPANQQ